MFSKQTQTAKPFDPLTLDQIENHPALAEVKAEFSAAVAEHEQAKEAHDAILAKASNQSRGFGAARPTWHIKHRREINERRERLEAAEERLEIARERYTKAVSDVRAQIKEAWLAEARNLFVAFKEKLLALQQDHEALREHSARAGSLFGVTYPWITFRAFTKTSGGESAFDVWCKIIAHELGLNNGKD